MAIKMMNEVLEKLPRQVRKNVAMCALKFKMGKVLLRWYHSKTVYLTSFPRSGRTWLRLMLGKTFALHFGLENVDLFELDEMAATHPEVPSIVVTHDDSPHTKFLMKFQ